jgi:hypothetical protein
VAGGGGHKDVAINISQLSRHRQNFSFFASNLLDALVFLTTGIVLISNIDALGLTEQFDQHTKIMLPKFS